MTRMRFGLLFSLLAAAILVSVAVLPAAADQERVYRIRLATIAPDGTPWAEQITAYSNQLQEQSGGRLRVQGFLGGTLGDENVTVQETRRGAIQVFGGSTAALATSVPELSVLELPYLFRNLEEVDHILDEVVYEDFRDILWERGFVLLFWAENGWRSFATRGGFVKSPDELQGKRMRSQENEVHLRTYRALGASPVPIAATEVLSSLQTGVVDGFDNTPLFAFASSWYQGITHYTDSRHIYQPGIAVMSRRFFETLPEDLQQIIRSTPEAARAEARSGREGVRALTPLLLENFEAAGVSVHRPSDAELDGFAQKTRPVHDWYRQNAGERGRRIYDKIDAALKARRGQ
jgi:TRAP-type transport system periplasmic protein